MNVNRLVGSSVSRKAVCLVICLITALLYTEFSNYDLRQTSDGSNKHEIIISNYFSVRKDWKTSNLGSILFKNTDPDIFIHSSRENKTFTILIWKYWDQLSPRHVYRFNKKRTGDVDVLKDCQFHNCIFTGDNKTLNTADAVVVHMQHGDYPIVQNRITNQRWIALSDEAPVHTFSRTKNKPKLSSLAGKFNWTMTYRSDSNIPVPSGRTVPLDTPIQVSDDPYLALMTLVPYFSEKQADVSTAILISNCYKSRMNKLDKIQNYLAIDVYGKCGTVFKNLCPGHFKQDCPSIHKYYFYLAFENASCRQYLTEKVFYHAYEKGAIPIIIGPTIEDCEKLLPPNSFIHFDKFENLKIFADTIDEIASSYEKLLYYHAWRQHFAVINEHGYFGTKSYHYCRVCEALNFNDGERFVYDKNELALFFDSRLLCR